MGLVREPKGVDLIVGPSTLTEHDRQLISEIISNYKRTGKLPSNKPAKKTRHKRRRVSSNKKVKRTFLKSTKKSVK